MRNVLRMCMFRQNLLGSTERIVQEIDSVEYGLTDIQEYYANTGTVQPTVRSDALAILSNLSGVFVLSYDL